MLLKSLELKGFKTFPEKTKLEFDDGISAVVGPNGSGKSNISDAMRWVMGEQSTKTLRCVRMEDVIFSGTNTRKAQGYAEVSLSMENCDRRLPFDSDTVVLTRRYYRSGESTYLLNGTTVRLKDIHELLMDTGLGRDGYSMIGQGKIDAIISAKSEERREIFEEAAGISRYRYRKEEAERKLQKTEENLVRLLDVLSEIEERVEPLKKQAETAKMYLSLYAEKRKAELSLWLATLAQSSTLMTQQNEKLAIATGERKQLDAKLKQIEAEIEQLFANTNQCLLSGEKARDARAETERQISTKEREIVVLETQLQHNEETLTRLAQEELQLIEVQNQDKTKLTHAKQLQATLQQTVQKQQETLLQYQTALANAEEALQATIKQITEQQSQLTALRDQEEAQRLAVARADAQLITLQERKQQIHGTMVGWQEQMEQLQHRISCQRESSIQADTTLTRAKRELQQLEQMEQEQLQERERLKQQRDEAYLSLQETRRRCRLLEEMERNLEGYGHSVKFLLKKAQQQELQGILGTSSQLITTENAYALAIETALGSAAQHLVVTDEMAVKEAIALLQKHKGGRATFLPLTTIKGTALTAQSFTRHKGFVGVACDCCQYAPQYQNIVTSLLGRVLLCDTLYHGIAMAKEIGHKYRIVTLDGQVLHAGGSMTGGSSSNKSGLFSRKVELSKLYSACQAQEESYQIRNTKLQAIEAQLQQLQQKQLQHKAVIAQAQQEHLVALSDLHQLEAEKNQLHLQQSKDKAELDQLQVQQEQLQQKLSSTQQQEQNLVQARHAITTQLQGLVDRQQKQQAEKNALQEEQNQLQLQLLAIQKDQESALQTLAQLQENQAQLQEKVHGITAQQQQCKADIIECEQNKVALLQSIEALKKVAIQLEEETLQAQKQRLHLEEQTAKRRSKEKEWISQRELLVQECTRLQGQVHMVQQQYDTIIEQLWNEYELTKREAQAEAEPAENLGETTKQVKQLKNKIKQLGHVNVDAIEEYQALSQRYQFLKAQLADIESSKAELHKLLGDLTKQMTKAFIESFQQINQHFQTIFTELFGGGKAQLELTDPENVLQSGITILAKPPGKLVKNLELLSGGEKALVAVALYFAIMRVNPPPFCMLDEIEAALDDVNVVRFAAYLRKMNTNTQFIVITHRRGTMEEADVLYGVTMQEEGISRLLKLENLPTVQQTTIA